MSADEDLVWANSRACSLFECDMCDLAVQTFCSVIAGEVFGMWTWCGPTVVAVMSLTVTCVTWLRILIGFCR